MKKHIRHIAKFFAGMLLLFHLFSLGWVIIYGFIPIPITKLMLIEKQEKDIEYTWVDLDDVSDQLQLAVMCAEDQFFLLHNGLDFKSIGAAMEVNYQRKRKRGASTISQQVAKNIFLWPDRSWLRKGIEVYYTLLIEIIWSKQRIMEVYLNIAEFGDGIFGVEAAAKHYFKGSASMLTARQSAKLAAVLPSPKRYTVWKPTAYVKRRVGWIEKQMGYWGNKMTYDKAFLAKMNQ